MSEALARVRYYTTGGNTGVSWHAVPVESFSHYPKEGELLYSQETVEALRAELAEARRDVEQAAGELIVAMPEPGTDMARVMLANAMMRRERDEARRDRNALRGWLDAVRRYLPPDATEARDIVRDALDGET